MEPSVLFLFDGNPGYIPPYRVSSQQVTGGRPFEERIKYHTSPMCIDFTTPVGEYDIADCLRRHGLYRRFDFVVVPLGYAGPFPRNLDEVASAKILIISDTHHGVSPLTTVVNYALSEGFHKVAATYNRQHLHWFAELGMDVGWFPGLPVPPIHVNKKVPRNPQLVHCGQAGLYHPNRVRLLSAIQSSGLPLHHMMGTAKECREQYASNLLSVNRSLNGDLNMRVFEVASAGGCLLTDKLSAQSGLNLVFDPSAEFEEFSSEEEMLDKARYYLSHPARAEDIARLANLRFEHQHRQDIRLAQLRRWMQGGSTPADIPPDDGRAYFSRPYTQMVTQRLGLYQAAQELQRSKPGVTVKVEGPMSAIVASDLSDLRGVRLHLTDTALIRSDTDRLRCSDFVTWLQGSHSENIKWDILVKDKPD